MLCMKCNSSFEVTSVQFRYILNFYQTIVEDLHSLSSEQYNTFLPRMTEYSSPWYLLIKNLKSYFLKSEKFEKFENVFMNFHTWAKRKNQLTPNVSSRSSFYVLNTRTIVYIKNKSTRCFIKLFNALLEKLI